MWSCRGRNRSRRSLGLDRRSWGRSGRRGWLRTAAGRQRRHIDNHTAANFRHHDAAARTIHCWGGRHRWTRRRSHGTSQVVEGIRALRRRVKVTSNHCIVQQTDFLADGEAKTARPGHTERAASVKVGVCFLRAGVESGRGTTVVSCAATCTRGWWCGWI